MATQLQGFTTANIAEVEANTRALRTVLKPDDYGSLGIYAIGLTSGIMAAGLTAASVVYSFRFAPGGGNLAIVKRILISAGDTATAFTAGVVTFKAFVARSFSVSASGGTAATLTGNNGKLRTSMATTGLTDLRISSTAALTAGTRTIDAQEFASSSGSITATAGTPLTQPIELWNPKPGDYPLVLATSEGFEIQATVPATGTWTFSVTTVWEELASYS